MKYKITNDKTPEINSIILKCDEKTGENYIGIVNKVDSDSFCVVLLDRNGYLIINKNENWLNLSLNSLPDLRSYYKNYIGKNVDTLIHDSYSRFYEQYIKK
jgi:hypothetical protein